MNSLGIKKPPPLEEHEQRALADICNAVRPLLESEPAFSGGEVAQQILPKLSLLPYRYAVQVLECLLQDNRDGACNVLNMFTQKRRGAA